MTGTARAEKLDFVRSLGADHVIDYTTTDWTRSGERWDWIIDMEARHSVLHVRRALTPHGAFVSLGAPTALIFDGMLLGPVVSKATGRAMSLLTWWKPFQADDVQALTELVGAGSVVPRIDRSFPLDEVVDALRYVDEGHARGKVLVIP